MALQSNEYALASPVDLSGMAPGAAAEWVVARHWDDALPILPELIARRLGIEVVFMNGDETSQVCRGPDGALRIAVDRADSRLRQRFAIAHVLGHILLRHGQPPLEAWNAFGNNAPDVRDQAANLFAASLLVPSPHLRWCVSSGWIWSVKQMVKTFWVPDSVLVFRYERLLAGR